MRILIAEDDATSRIVLAGVLKKHGHEVVETADGAAAWEALRQTDAPRLAILDWMMPEMDGVEVVRRVRALRPAGPPYLVMLTTKGNKPDIISALEAGANDYIAKPFDAGELRARVDVGRRMVEMEAALAARVEELREALDRIDTLSGLLPVCAWCRKIRSDDGHWKALEAYVSENTKAHVSHGMCPDCYAKAITA